MSKKILKVIKKIIFGFALIYSFNLIAMPLNILVGINAVTVTIVSTLGIPGLLMIVLMKLFI